MRVKRTPTSPPAEQRTTSQRPRIGSASPSSGASWKSRTSPASTWPTPRSSRPPPETLMVSPATAMPSSRAGTTLTEAAYDARMNSRRWSSIAGPLHVNRATS
jgi:hypothetical protein